MHPRVDLHLLKDYLGQLSETPYFNPNLENFLQSLLGAIDHVLDNPGQYPIDIVRSFVQRVWRAQKYLSGSISREAPYEMQFCLSKALKEWIDRECIVTNALLDDKNFHLARVDLWDYVKTVITGYDSSNFDAWLVLIGVPRLYQYKPIYCIPLYHELGHFVDFSLGLTQLSLLLSPAPSVPPASSLNSKQWHAVVAAHRQEHFADLFAACYCGQSSIRTLATIADGHGATTTHPATAARIALVERFLSGTSDPLVDLFQSVLGHLGKPVLRVRYNAPKVLPFFDDVRPYTIGSEAELHGLFESAWDYLEAARNTRSAPWIRVDTNEATIERVVNNLTEKSIRNMAIREKWDHVAIA